MTSHIVQSCARNVWGIDSPEALGLGTRAVGEPSAELLDRAMVGWERFTGADEEQPDV
ncbi:hypothetical protein [Streptomyces sp. NPDC046685]|uniref:hypothetical protein n=1 Tax=Streptomyces sp. NPDC046685 TaxID=3157202 RepID=UPI0033E752E5